ncbi:2-octaprenyl-6-methoxyphenyl hydroxylase [Sulfuricaulis sp.]|jgi:2-octaprenyl-6-methoxyphenol hydroxylase|uniref:2-octaprenyl-6-methoxyphenyl hydroxylase n=1 Tax=Sulfuricaulis sp. TaxID=2003553 RepID=UPI003559CEBD
MKTDYDILIIGGGLVGASLACALRASGLRLGVIEAVPLAASSQPGYDDRTLALAYGSKRIFETLGVWEGIVPETTRIDRIHISDRGHFGVTRLTAAEAGLPALGYVVPNRALGAALLKALESSRQIDWLCPAEMRDIRVTQDHAAVTVHHEGKDKMLTARLVIAADGAHSAVRQAMGIEAVRTEYRQTAIVTTVTASQPHGNTAYERFTDTGPLALLPQRQNDCAVVWSARAEEVKTILGWSDAEFLRQLQERFGDRLGDFTRLGRRASYPLALTRVPEQVRARLALIGNAAHTVHPVAGQGFNLGLRDVAAVADILADAHRAGNDIGDLTVLRRYADWRRRDNQVISLFTNGLIRIFSNNIFPLTLLRNAGLLAVDLMPGIKRGFVRVTSGLAGKLPRLARGLPL